MGVAGVMASASPRPAGAQVEAPAPDTARLECPDGRVSQVFIDNHSIFDPQELAGERRFRWAYELINTLHIRTRPRFIRRELLFEPGACYDPLLLAESERVLREYPFIARADVFGLFQPDGSWHVVVDTQDEWTTKINLGVRVDGSLRLETLAVTEENFLGRGVLLGGFIRTRGEEREHGGLLRLPRLGRTRTDTHLSWGRTRTGDFLGQSFQYPFVGEVGRLAGREVYLRRETSFPYSTGARKATGSGAVTHVILPMDAKRFELTMAGRIGQPGNLTIFGVGFSHETLEYPGFPEDVEVAVDEDFDDLQPGDSAAAEAVRHQTRHPAGTRVNLLVGQRNVRFRQFSGLDALRGTQDVALGTDLALTLGRTVATRSDDAVDRDLPDDLYVRLRVRAGAAPGPFLLLFGGGLEGRRSFLGDADGWTDLLADLSLLMYWQPRDWPRHTFFARVAGGGGWQVTQPYQLTLGGAGSVRGYDVNDFPGGRRVVFSAEDRVYLGWPKPNLFDLGMTLFADVGSGWAGDVPYGVDTGWRGTLGGGLRLGFPAGTRGVVRLDLAWPVEGKGLGSPVFRVQFGDPLGLLLGRVDRQLARSRRLAIGPDLFTVR